MEQPDSLNQVADFHKTFGHPILPSPTVPSPERCALRVALIREELHELEVAAAKMDIVEIADALCDIQYVLSGAVLEFGLGEKFSDLFGEVQRSNMSKRCVTETEAQATVEYYKNTRGVDSYYKQQDGHYLVYRTADNKTLKSVNYSPPDLKAILEK